MNYHASREAGASIPELAKYIRPFKRSPVCPEEVILDAPRETEPFYAARNQGKLPSGIELTDFSDNHDHTHSIQTANPRQRARLIKFLQDELHFTEEVAR